MAKLQERLVQAKAASGISWAALARRSGYSKNYIRRVAKGERHDMTLTCAYCVAKTLGVSPAWLAGWEDE